MMPHNKIKVIKLLPFILLTFLNAQSCKSPTAPEALQPGRRDYTWTADTIKTINDNLMLTRIWGITPTDVWAVGNSDWTALTIWHYDGSRWNCDSTGRLNNPWAIIGFSSNEVWMGNTNSTIWKFDGSQWSVYGTYKVAGFDETWIMNFDGTSSNNIYGVGSANMSNGSDYIGLIMHYDGISWKILNIPPVKVGFGFCALDNNSGALIIGGTDFDTTGWVEKAYAWNGSQLNEIYSGSDEAAVSNINHNAYIDINKRIYKYKNGKLELWKNISNTDCSGVIWCGRSESDFFIGSSTGIAHYNGSDFKTLYITYGSNIMGGFIFEKDVFFILHNFNTDINVIVHGKLK